MVLGNWLATPESNCILWLPGPGRNSDLQRGVELQSALKDLNAGKFSPWLHDRLYDPTNGTTSAGAIVEYLDSKGKRMRN